MKHERVIVGKRTVTCSCGGEVRYSERWDAYFCVPGATWLEPECTCNAEDCQFRGRPEKPDNSEIEALLDEDWEYSYEENFGNPV